MIVDQLSSSSSSCYVTLLVASLGKMIGCTTNSSKWAQLYVDMIVCHSVHFWPDFLKLLTCAIFGTLLIKILSPIRCICSGWPRSHGATPITSGWISFLIYGWCRKEEQRSPECRISNLAMQHCQFKSWSWKAPTWSIFSRSVLSLISNRLVMTKAGRDFWKLYLKKKKNTEEEQEWEVAEG